MENGYTYVWMLMIYGFVGWCLETVFLSVKNKKFIYSGLLNGPICPIYAVVMILIEEILGKYNRNLLLVFLAAVLFTAALEFVVGSYLAKSFGTKWWDYSESKFNLNGIVCLEKTIAWSVVTTVVAVFVQPWVIKLIDITTSTAALIVITVLLLLFVIDFILTLLEIITISRKLRAVDQIMGIISKVKADKQVTLFARAKQLDSQSYANLEKVMKKYKGTIKSNSLIHKRISNAFPNLCHQGKIEEIAKIRELYWYMKNK